MSTSDLESDSQSQKIDHMVSNLINLLAFRALLYQIREHTAYLIYESTNYYNIAWVEGFAIFLAVFIVVFVGSYNDYKKEEQFFKLYALDQQGKMVSIRIYLNWDFFAFYCQESLLNRHPLFLIYLKIIKFH